MPGLLDNLLAPGALIAVGLMLAINLAGRDRRQDMKHNQLIVRLMARGLLKPEDDLDLLAMPESDLTPILEVLKNV